MGFLEPKVSSNTSSALAYSKRTRLLRERPWRCTARDGAGTSLAAYNTNAALLLFYRVIDGPRSISATIVYEKPALLLTF